MSARFPSRSLSGKLSVLVAYPYASAMTLATLRAYRPSIELIIDSGAFTAWNTGREIKLDDYCRFLDSIEDLRPFYAVQLDVFGDPEGSAKNLEIMRRRGYDVMPVFTRGESVERLEELYAMTDYIMFGGIVVGGQNRNYIAWFEQVNQGRAAHWLGFVKMPFIRKYKPRSVDSSSWVNSARWGLLFDFDPAIGHHVWYKRQDLHTPARVMLKSMREMGLPTPAIKLLGQQASWQATTSPPSWAQTLDYKPEPSSAHLLSILGHIRRSLWTQLVYGTRIYLAAGAHHTRMLLTAYEFGLRIGAWHE